jgi:(2Fe-2S) ferredoxin
MSQSIPSTKVKNIPPYRRHVFVCTGSRCAPDSSQDIYQSLKRQLKEMKLDQVAIRRSQSQCFGICEGGPILLVYPEGTWYHHVTLEKLDVIIEQHLIAGKPVVEWLIPSNPFILDS